MSWGGDSSASDEMNQRLDDQQATADAETERKRKNLERDRLQMVKSQGAQQWVNPDAPTQPTEPTEGL